MKFIKSVVCSIDFSFNVFGELSADFFRWVHRGWEPPLACRSLHLLPLWCSGKALWFFDSKQWNCSCHMMIQSVIWWQSTFLFVSRSFGPCVCMFLSMCVSLCLSVCPSSCAIIAMYVQLFFNSYICLSALPSLFLSIQGTLTEGEGSVQLTSSLR